MVGRRRRAIDRFSGEFNSPKTPPYIDPTLASYVGEEVMLRYDPRDMAEIRLFYQNRFLCRKEFCDACRKRVSVSKVGLFRRICGYGKVAQARLRLDRMVSPPTFAFAPPR
jgi:putative transposase